ncbi:hypothetical protein SAMN04487948_1245 [Halogranum amylolyticum]|uniref:Uncharacterized protein n=1 Tax=Halogranum amylolyticum TaxID=660520 RepID=A0A1H8W5N0_9EURY|nr:DNA modification system-associated small protein [Halogranum amylolyticum]SEP22956.1 hypothetical protein SAMN04487948_1245 [Halogranum amylolyticum]
MNYGDDGVDDEEIHRLIEKYAEEHGVPAGLLMEIYDEESKVVGMDRRSSILKDVSSALESYVDDFQLE